jgi:hypothetical protein
MAERALKDTGVIPAWNQSGVLPPFVGTSPADRSGVSPYSATMREIAERFCTSPRRVQLFRGLVSFRKALLGVGISQGFQWINGSYLENVETVRGASPKDIDLVTLFVRPQLHQDQAAWNAFFVANRSLFDSKATAAAYGCEAFAIDVGLSAFLVAPQITYWFGLFTHQRVTLIWKGILQVPLVGDDDDAIAYVDTLRFAP